MREAFKQISGGIADLASLSLWAQSVDDLTALVVQTGDLASRLLAVQALASHELAARGVPRQQGASSTTTWLRDHARITAPAARRQATLGSHLEARPAVRDAVLDGHVNVEQAAVIGEVVRKLSNSLSALSGPLSALSSPLSALSSPLSALSGPQSAPSGPLPAPSGPVSATDPAATDRAATDRAATDPAATDPAATDRAATGSAAPGDPMPVSHGRTIAEIVDQCESALIEFADRHDPAQLQILGTRVLALIAPEIAEEADRRAVERDEKRAAESRSLTVSPDGTGMWRITGKVGALDAAILQTTLRPLCKPKTFDDERRDERTANQRRADALIDICRRVLAGGELPAHGGIKPQVNVTCDVDVLRNQLGIGILDTGAPISATTVRQLACDASILPAVMNSAGAVLDVGTKQRLFTGPIRRALILRDGGCAFPGCDRPPDWCDGHHVRHYADGGPTCLANGVLLCAFHHRLLHTDPAWEVFIDPSDGLPSFRPPAYIDLQRKPIRNMIHRLRQ